MTVGSENAKSVKRGNERKPKWSFGSVRYWPSKLKAKHRPTLHVSNDKLNLKISRKEQSSGSLLLVLSIITLLAGVLTWFSTKSFPEFLCMWCINTFAFLFILSWPCLIFVMLRRLIKKRPSAQYRSKNSKF